ncbi:phage terminase small subunit [Staphylococcus epidermidis]
MRNEKAKDYIQSKKDEIIDDTILTAKETLYLLSRSAVGEETEVKDVVVKKSSFEKNPDTGHMNLVYNEHVELVEVPIKASDRLKACDLLGRYHSIFTDKVYLYNV